MASALTEYAQNKLATYQALLDGTKSSFNTASSELNSSQTNYEAVVSAAAELDKQIASNRSQTAASSNSPAEVESLAAELRQLLIDRRHASAALAKAEEALNFAKINVEAYQKLLKANQQKVSECEEDLTQFSTEGEKHALWMSAATEEAIAELRDKAADILSESYSSEAEEELNPGDIYAAASERISSDIPAVLLERARARSAQVESKHSAHREAMESIVISALIHDSSAEGANGLLNQRWAECLRAEAALQTYALGSNNNYQQAISLLQKVASSERLSEAESQRIADLALEADAEEISSEAALNDARSTLAEAKVAVSLALIEAVKADVNADPNDNGDVQSAKASLASAEASLSSAESHHSTVFANRLDLWEAAVPEHIWANLQDYDSAVATLSELSANDGASITSHFIDAEASLVSALTAADRAESLQILLHSAVNVSAAQCEFLRGTKRRASLLAMRGDY